MLHKMIHSASQTQR